MTAKPSYEELEQRISELSESEEKYRHLFETAMVGIYRTRIEDGKFLAANRTLTELLGYSSTDQLVAEYVTSRHYTDPNRREELLTQIQSQGRVDGFEIEMTRTDGSLVQISISAAAYPEHGYLEGVVTDITERKHMEEELRESEERYRNLFELSPDGIIIWQDEKAALINPAVMHMFGATSADEIIGRSIFDIHPADFHDKLRARLQYVHETNLSAVSTEYKLIRLNGELIDVETTGTQIIYKNHPAVLSLYRDISDRKQAEEALRESERRYRSLTANLNVGVYRNTTGPSGKFIEANPAIVKMFGYDSREEFLSVSVSDLYKIPEDRKEYNTKMLRVGSVKNEELQLQRKDGTSFTGSVSAVVVKGDSDEVKYYDGIIEDITKRKQAEEALKASESRFRILFERSNDAIFVVNTKTGQYLDANKAAERLTGRSLPELVNMKTKDVSPEGTSKRLKKLSGIKPDKALINFGEVSYVRPDGNERIAILNAIPVSDEIVFGIAQDITESKKAEEQLRQTQKMEAIGTLAGGIAHDFNNILTPFIGHTEMAMMDIPQDYPAQNNLKEALNAAYRARDLVNQILAFSRRQDSAATMIRVGIIVKEAVKLLRASIPTTIDIQERFMAESDKILADPTQIHQIIMNLCTNAAHAMLETGGILEVTTENELIELNGLSQIGELLPGEYLKLTIRDTGHGIDQAVLQRIFEPYYTTKDKQHGTGLGLSVVHGIVQALQGGLTIKSKPGEGSIFSVYFPLAVHEKNGREDSLTAEELPAGNERILLVDDEKSMVDTVQSMLERLGYKVTARTSSIEALELFKNKQEAFDLIITDHTMPNMTGRELAEEIMSVRKDLPIILCTGYSEQIDETKAKAMGISAYVMKPILINEIAVVIRQVLKGNQ